MVIRTPPTRIERRKEKTRRALMDVALGLFYEKGIYWTKIEDITERADIGKGTFYQYFETKEELLQALLQRGLESLLVAMSEAVRAAGAGAKTLGAVIQGQVDFYLKHPEYLLLFHQVRGLLQLKAEHVKGLRDVYDGYLDRLAALLRPALNGAARQGGAVRDLSMAVSAFTSGLVTFHLLFGGAGDLRRRRETIQRQLERSIQALR